MHQVNLKKTHDKVWVVELNGALKIAKKIIRKSIEVKVEKDTKKYEVIKDYPTINGMLHKGEIVTIADNLNEKFYSGKTRALYGTHISVGDKMFSSFPYLRSLATITWDTLDWYGYDKDGGSVHDVIGTRCDPYTYKLTSNKH